MKANYLYLSYRGIKAAGDFLKTHNFKKKNRRIEKDKYTYT